MPFNFSPTGNKSSASIWSFPKSSEDGVGDANQQNLCIDAIYRGDQEQNFNCLFIDGKVAPQTSSPSTGETTPASWSDLDDSNHSSNSEELTAFSKAQEEGKVYYEDTLGQGRFGVVELFVTSKECKNLKEYYAVKSGKKADMEKDLKNGLALGGSDRFLNVIGLIPSDQEEETQVLMDYIDGSTLSRRGIQSYDEIERFLKELDEAFEYAKSKNCIPIDVHDENLMITEDEEGLSHLVLIDVGDYELCDQLNDSQLLAIQSHLLKPRVFILLKVLEHMTSEAGELLDIGVNQDNKNFLGKVGQVIQKVEQFHDLKRLCLESEDQFTWDEIEKDQVLSLSSMLDSEVKRLAEMLNNPSLSIS